ncbi:MAG: phospholipase [Bacteroides sp.]|nr:phospholipase [Bacteroides sp.]
MWVLLICLIFIALVALGAGYIHNRDLQRKRERGEETETSGVQQPDSECCGQHATCEKDSLLAAVSKEIEYYDDEELDQFIGSGADEYSEEDTEIFREVFYTMREEDVPGWIRSLQLRGIALPDALKDEVILIVGEKRAHG